MSDRAKRYSLASIEASVDGNSVTLLNVSSTGILVSTTSRSYEPDDPIQADLVIPIFDHLVGLRIKGRVVRQTDDGIAIAYETPARTWSRLLDLMARKETGTA